MVFEGSRIMQHKRLKVIFWFVVGISISHSFSDSFLIQESSELEKTGKYRNFTEDVLLSSTKLSERKK